MKVLILTLCLLITFGSAGASTIKFSEVKSKDLSGILDGLSDNIVEFKKGDLIPLNMKIEGDLLSLSKNETNFLKVKKDFFIKSDGSSLLISFDGQDYRSLGESLTGSLSVGANGNTLPTMLNILLHVEVR